jgi:hypothetical protein
MKNSVTRAHPAAPPPQGCLHFRLAETSSLRSEVTRVFRSVTLVVEEVLKRLDPVDHLIYDPTSSRHHSLIKLTFWFENGGHLKVRIAAGGLSIDQEVLRALIKVPELDFLTLDIYSLRSLRTDLALAEEAKKAGKHVYIEETWRPSLEFGSSITEKPGPILVMLILWQSIVIGSVSWIRWPAMVRLMK